MESYYEERETYSPKRDRDADDESMGSSGTRELHSKRLRKIKAAVPPMEKDRTRGRYACLGHRMKHKRCPLDCPERRPKPSQELSPSDQMPSSPQEEQVQRPASPIHTPTKVKTHRVKKIPIKVEESVPLVAPKNQSPATHQQPSAPEEAREVSHWDAPAGWENFGWDSEHNWRNEASSFTELKSGHQWGESKGESFRESSSSMDEAKLEEDEIIDSWLNEEEFASATLEPDSSERSPAETDSERRTPPASPPSNLLESLAKILLTRDMLERWTNEPYFNRLVTGCFVRVTVGECMGSPIHRIALIDEVIDSFYYNHSLASSGLSKGLTLRIGGSSKKTFPIYAITNQPPTEDETRSWLEEMEKSCLMIDPMEIQHKEEIVRVLHIKYPTADLSQLTEPLVKEPLVWTSC